MAGVPQAAAVFGAPPIRVGAMIACDDVLHGLRLFLDAGFRAAELEEQHRRFTQRQIRVAIDGAHGVAHRRKRADGGGNGFGLRVEPHGNFGDDAERAFGADE